MGKKLNDNKFVLFGLFLLGAWLVLSLSPAMAQQGGLVHKPSFSKLINNFQKNTSFLWRSKSLAIGRQLFGIFAIINIMALGLSIIWDRLKPPPASAIIADLIFLGVFYALLTHFDSFDAIVYGFKQIAHAITGVQNDLTTTGLFWDGLYYLWKSVEYFMGSFSLLAAVVGIGGDPLSAIFILLSGVILFCGFTGIALQYGFLTVKMILYVVFGPIFLAFFPLNIFREVPQKYIANLIHLGIQFFVFYVIIGFSYSILGGVFDGLNVHANITDLWQIQKAFTTGFMSALTVFLLGKLPKEFADSVAPTEVEVTEFLSSKFGI